MYDKKVAISLTLYNQTLLPPPTFHKKKMESYNECKDFNVGDILYAKVQYAGCSYHYQFVKVIRKTKTGRYRVATISHKKNGKETGDLYHRYTPVVPDESISDETGTTFLIMPNGYKKNSDTWTGLWFKKYDDSLNLSTYWDRGD